MTTVIVIPGRVSQPTLDEIVANFPGTRVIVSEDAAVATSPGSYAFEPWPTHQGERVCAHLGYGPHQLLGRIRAGIEAFEFKGAPFHVLLRLSGTMVRIASLGESGQWYLREMTITTFEQNYPNLTASKAWRRLYDLAHHEQFLTQHGESYIRQLLGIPAGVYR